MKKTLAILFAAILVGCSSVDHDVRAPKLKIDGYGYSLKLPVTSIPPGTVIMRWNDDFEPIVRPDQYRADQSSVVWTNPVTTIGEEQSRAWSARISALISSELDARLGFSHARHVTNEFRIVPLEINYAGGPQALAEEAEASPALAKAVRQEIKNETKFKFLSIVTKVAMVDYCYVFESTNKWDVSGSTLSSLTNLGGLSVSVSIDATNSRRLFVKSANGYVAYSTKDGMFKKYVDRLRQTPPKDH
jgi:hypothetical protein